MASIGTAQAKVWQSGFRNRDARIMGRMREIYGDDGGILESRRGLYLQAVDAFIGTFGADREAIISRAPGRINLLGNHIEHRGGYVNYMAIDRDTLLVASPREDDAVVMHNANAERFGPREVRIGQMLPPDRRGDWMRFIEGAEITPGDWGNYVLASVLHLQDRFADRSLRGLDLTVHGDVPIAAGLSSSSTLVVTALEAMLAFNGLEIPEAEKAEFCGHAEWYVGTRGGAGDHAAMLYGKRQSILHLQFFPLRTEEVPFPSGYRVVACNSFVEHTSRSIFNERIATYEIGLMLVREKFPQYADRLIHLRDLNSTHLSVSPSVIYRILKSLPERMSRDEIRSQLPAHGEVLDSLFAPHVEPEDGYRVRQVVLFGLSESARGAVCGDLLRRGEFSEFGKLKYLSHDGDRRVSHTSGGEAVARDNRISDADLDRLVADLEGDDPVRADAAQIHLQPGGYDCSCEELDLLVDLARDVDGVIGAGLAGGGLGGCVLAVVKEESVDDLIRTVDAGYYTPRDLSDGTLVCTSVAGSGLF